MLAWVTVAMAVACDGATTVQHVVDGLVATETSLRGGTPAAPTSGDLLEALTCLGEPLPAALAGRAYRAVAAGRLEDGDRAGAMAWLTTAAEVDGGFAYGVEDVPAGHPLAVAWRVATGSAAVDPVVVGAPVAGRHLLDGRRLTRLEARPNRQHIYQTDASGQWVTTAIDGAAFPSGSVANAGGPTAAVSSQPVGPVAVQRQRPKEKTPLLVTSGLLLAGAGALYGGSFATRAAFDDATTTDEASRLRTTTNALVLGSAAVLAAGAGTLSWGVLLSDPGLSLGVRF